MLSKMPGFHSFSCDIYITSYFHILALWKMVNKKRSAGNSLAVQWLGLGAFTSGVQVQSLMSGN